MTSSTDYIEAVQQTSCTAGVSIFSNEGISV